jgi:hypothetical protein
MSSKQNYLTLPKGCEVSSIGLKITKRLSYSEWEALGARLQAVHKSILFWLGDWLLWGAQSFNEDFSQAIEATGYRNQTLLNAQWVASAVDNSRRRENLSWSHHLEIAALDDPSEQDKLLQLAIDNHWSTRELREEVRKLKTPESTSQRTALISPKSNGLEVFSQPAHRRHLTRDAINPEEISRRAIEFLKSELEGAREQEVGQVIGAIVKAFANDLSQDWDEFAVLKEKTSKQLVTVSRVKAVFGGGRVLR